MTTWSRYDNHWGGVRFRTIAELAVPKDEARFVLCTGYDFMPGSYIPYTVNVPLARAVGARTCCWCTRGRASRCRASTAARAG